MGKDPKQGCEFCAVVDDTKNGGEFMKMFVDGGGRKILAGDRVLDLGFAHRHC